MDITITKGSDRDWLHISRPDGTEDKSTFPKKGMIPHDIVHYIVEQELAFLGGFWGYVANGTAISDIQEIAKNAGHASSKRAEIPEQHVIELLQAERIVECFEADQWSSGTDYDTFRDVIEAACASSHVPAPKIDDLRIEKIRAQISEFTAKWTTTPVGDMVQITWGTD